jgi:hypothetical protein
MLQQQEITTTTCRLKHWLQLLKHNEHSITTNNEQLLQLHATTITTCRLKQLDGAVETPWT